MLRVVALLLASLAAVSASAATDIDRLPPPALTQSGHLQLLKLRQSQRDFSDRPIPRQVLADILWAAYGVNRQAEGKRTAPSSNNKQEIDVYAVLASGAYRYDARAHGLVQVSKKDLRAKSGRQGFVADAPLNLVYVLDYNRTPNSPERAREVGGVAVGAIAQNVYLYCAENGLATVYRGWIDIEALSHAMQLRENQFVVGAQTVGYPREK